MVELPWLSEAYGLVASGAGGLGSMCYARFPFASELLVLVSVSSLGCGASRFACEAFVFVAVSFVGLNELRTSSERADSQAHGGYHLPWLVLRA